MDIFSTDTWSSFIDILVFSFFLALVLSFFPSFFLHYVIRLLRHSFEQFSSVHFYTINEHLERLRHSVVLSDWHGPWPRGPWRGRLTDWSDRPKGDRKSLNIVYPSLPVCVWGSHNTEKPLSYSCYCFSAQKTDITLKVLCIILNSH